MAEGKTGLDRFIEQRLADALTGVGPAPSPTPHRPARSGPLDIAIPIFNNASALRECLAVLPATLSPGDRVWLADDASSEPEIAQLCKDFAGRWPDTRIIRNERNLGFVGNANRLIEETGHDLVLLNSDTRVMAGWLEHLQACLERDDSHGIACPLSDSATILSVLPAGSGDKPPVELETTTCGDVLLPTAVGFCMLLRRRMLDEIGVFSQVFAPGYGEENDLSLRALRAGWNIVAADQAGVLHRSGGSFGSERSRALQRAHGEKLDRLWPEYGALVRSWWRDSPLRNRTEQLAEPETDQPAVVHVLHRQYHVGGTERVTRDLVAGLSPHYAQQLIYPGETDNAWCDFETRGDVPCRELMLNSRWIRPATLVGGHAADLACTHSERALARVVRGSGAQVVHFHHLLHWDSLLLPLLAAELGCRVVISVHDFWFNCPIHNQLEHSTGQVCGRPGLTDDARCGQCLEGHGSALADFSAYSRGRQDLLRRVLKTADAVCVPSKFIREKILAGFGDELAENIRLLPHGVKISRPGIPAERSKAHRVIAYYGGDQVLKGARLVLELAQALIGQPLTFRIHGRIKAFDRNRLPPNVELHGFYDPARVGEVMRGVDLALVPSYYEESFSMVASECWAHGVPVLASHRGALAERVQPGINGWTVRDMNTSSWLDRLAELLQGDELDRCAALLADEPVRTLADSAADHHALYRELIEDTRPHAEPAQTAQTPPLAPRRFLQQVAALRTGVSRVDPRSTACLGVLRDHWGTANYRVRFPVEDLAAAGRCEVQFHSVREAGFDLEPLLASGKYRHIVVQPFLSDEGLAMMQWLHRYPGTVITLVIDDLWTGLMKDNPARAKMPGDVKGRLQYAAQLSQSVVLTSPALAEHLPIEHPNVHIINNALPADPWLSLPRNDREIGLKPRIGWVGAPQHLADLKFLKPVVEATRDAADWVFMGMCPDDLAPLAAEVHGMAPFDDYPAKLATLGLDLAIAPLTDTPFNRCKSHLKVLECGVLGIPLIAADLEPYRHCPVPLAAPDDTGAWVSTIREMLQNRQQLKARGESLRQWVIENHLSEHRRGAWLAALGIRHETD